MTTDGGENWKKVLYVGGIQWVRLHLKNLPRDIVIHPRENDLILGTHGRSIWILDDAGPLQQMNDRVLKQSAYLFNMRPALRYQGPRLRRAPDPEQGEEEGGGFRFLAVGPQVLPGKYTVRLTAGGQTLTRELEVRVGSYHRTGRIG